MARTKGNGIINVDEIIEKQQIEEKATTKRDDEKVDERLEKRRLENQRRREVREKIKKDTEIVIMNNCSNGSFFYRCPVKGIPIEFDKFGQETYITYEDLSVMQRQRRGILEKYWIIPVDVSSDEVTIEEVLETLGLDRLYTADMFYSDNLDYILLETKSHEFNNMIHDSNVKYAEMLAERAIVLYRVGKFTDVNRMKILAEKIGNKELFADLLESEQ